jgi:hypothetical protein
MIEKCERKKKREVEMKLERGERREERGERREERECVFVFVPFGN